MHLLLQLMGFTYLLQKYEYQTIFLHNHRSLHLHLASCGTNLLLLILNTDNINLCYVTPLIISVTTSATHQFAALSTSSLYLLEKRFSLMCSSFFLKERKQRSHCWCINWTIDTEQIDTKHLNRKRCIGNLLFVSVSHSIFLFWAARWCFFMVLQYRSALMISSGIKSKRNEHIMGATRFSWNEEEKNRVTDVAAKMTNAGLRKCIPRLINSRGLKKSCEKNS